MSDDGLRQIEHEHQMREQAFEQEQTDLMESAEEMS